MLTLSRTDVLLTPKLKSNFKAGECKVIFSIFVCVMVYCHGLLLLSCQKQVESNMMALVGKMVETEGVEICGFQGPETDMDNHYYTMVGITLFQMVDQNVCKRRVEVGGASGDEGGEKVRVEDEG